MGRGSMPAPTQVRSRAGRRGATGTPGGRSSHRLDDLAAAQAARADAYPLGPAVDDCPHRDEIRQPAALGHVVRMTDLVAHDRSLPAHVTALGHACWTPRER